MRGLCCRVGFSRWKALSSCLKEAQDEMELLLESLGAWGVAYSLCEDGSWLEG